MNDTRQKAGKVMQDMAYAMLNVSELLEGTQKLGDPVNAIEYPEIGVSLAKKPPTELDMATVGTQHGAVQLPNMTDLFDDPEDITCMAQKVNKTFCRAKVEYRCIDIKK